MARILVTGAAGFVGAALCPALAARGHTVVAGSRAGSLAVPGAVAAPGITPLALGSIGPETNWTRALAGVDAVIHLAQRAHRSPDIEAFAEQTAAVAALTRAAAAAGVRRLVLVSSIKAMGETTLPGRPFRADDAPRPEDSYGRAKLASERAAAAAASAIELVIIRPPLVYGPGVRANFRQLARLAASGLPLPLAAIDNRRSLVFLDNLVDLLAVAATHPAAAGKTLLVRDDDDLSTPALIRALAAGAGRPARLFALPQPALAALRRLPVLAGPLARLTLSLQIDDRATRAALGWAPPVAAATALAQTARALAG